MTKERTNSYIPVAYDHRTDRRRDITGVRFGRLTALKYVGKDARKKHFWECSCECGEIIIANIGALQSGNTSSCGCYRDEKALLATLRHGHGRRKKSPEYTAWQNMLGRCSYPNYIGYRNYGGRGITVCERWRSFEDFLSDMGKRPSSEYSLDRIDVNGNYEPENCRWATHNVQHRNKRDNVWLILNGERALLADVLKRLKVPPVSFYRLVNKGMPLHKAVLICAKNAGGSVVGVE